MVSFGLANGRGERVRPEGGVYGEVVCFATDLRSVPDAAWAHYSEGDIEALRRHSCGMVQLHYAPLPRPPRPPPTKRPHTVDVDSDDEAFAPPVATFQELSLIHI